MKKTILTIAGICISTSAFAGGYRVALQGQNATGMGHTGVAMTDTSEVVFFNPAGMVFLPSDVDMSAGATFIDGSTKYQNTTANTSSETDNPIGTPVSFYYARRQSENVSYGLGLYTPYGNTVKWPKDWAGSHLVNDIQLRTIYLQPTLAVKFNDKYSMGFGPTFVNGNVEFNRNLSTALVDENGDRSNVTVKAGGVNSWGYNIGFLAKPDDRLSIGISYRSRVDLGARDEMADFANIPSSLQLAYPDTTFNADLVLPAELTLGVSYRWGDDTTLAFDVNRSYWSAFKSLDIQFNNYAGTSVNPRNYVDANIYRFGVQHKLQDSLTLRAGVYFDRTPIKQGYYTPETARNDATGLTAGASYKVSEKINLDFSFLYLSFSEFEGSYDYYDQSGTTISFSGDYLTSVTAIGFGLNYKY